MFIDKYYVKTSPAGYRYDDALAGGIPAVYSGDWSDDTLSFDSIFEQYKETQKRGDDKGMRGDLRIQFEKGGFHLEGRLTKLQHPQTKIWNEFEKTFIGGIKKKSVVMLEAEGKASLFDEKIPVKENLDTKFYPGPSKAPDSFYYQLLHHALPDTKYVTARTDDVVNAADQKVKERSAHGVGAAAAKKAVRKAVEEEGDFTGDVPTPAKVKKPDEGQVTEDG